MNYTYWENRIKELMVQVGMPESQSLAVAFKQLVSETMQAALKEREAPPKAQPMSDAMFLERLLREGSQELVGLTTFVNHSIQGRGRVQLLASAAIIRDFIYRCHGIGD